jgi:hypothetical protein
VATCPHCRTYVNIKKNRTKYNEVETEQSLNINTNGKKMDSFDNSNLKAESNESVSP